MSRCVWVTRDERGNQMTVLWIAKPRFAAGEWFDRGMGWVALKAKERKRLVGRDLSPGECVRVPLGEPVKEERCD